jgi:hypothetical protein
MCLTVLIFNGLIILVLYMVKHHDNVLFEIKQIRIFSCVWWFLLVFVLNFNLIALANEIIVTFYEKGVVTYSGEL